MANLETKNTIERDETKEELSGLKKEVEKNINKELELEVDYAFNKFREKSDDEGNASLEKMGDGKLRLKSYWQTCEFDFKAGKILFMKWRIPIILDDFPCYGLDDFLKLPNGEKRDHSKNLAKMSLQRLFMRMNVFNKAVSISENHPNNRKFYFENGNLLQKVNPLDDGSRILKVDWESVISKWQLKNWGFYWGSDSKKGLSSGMAYKDLEKKIINTLNKIVE